MMLLLIVFCVFCRPLITDGVPVNSTTASSVPDPTTSFKKLMSRQIRDSYAVLPNNAKFSPRIKEDLPTKQHDNCICTYFIKDDNRLVDGERQPTAIRVGKEQTAVLQCIEPEMNLVWQDFGFTAKSVILTCNYCRMYTSQEIPSCHNSGLDEVHFYPTITSPVPVPKTRFKKSRRKIKDAKFLGRGKEQHDDCICSYSVKDNNRLVNGERRANEIRVQKGQRAVLHCIGPEMNLVWQKFEITAKSINLSCNVCHMYTPQEIPSCQSSRLDTDVRCGRFSDNDLNMLIVHYDDKDMRVGSTAQFSCKDNDQELSGINESVCLRNGKWSSPPPQCKDLCPPIDENADFAIFYSNGRNIDSSATFYCKDTKLVIQGDHIKACLPTGKWSEANPTCTDPVVRCTRFLDEELNLLIVHYDDKDIRVGSRANFSCKDNDQELSGINESVCLRNGKWSSPPPQCKDVAVRCTRFSDEDLKLLIVHYDDKDIRVGSTAQFSCKDKNQELSGKSESVCLRNGKWSSPPPHCKDLCPPIDENADFAIFYSNGRNIDSNATFYCKDTKLVIQGDHIKTCLPTGKWSAANPTCKEPVVHCTRFSEEVLKLLIVHYDDNDNRIGSTAKFSCKDKDQGLSGKNESVCQKNGKWASPPPQCKGCGTRLDDDKPQIMQGGDATEGAWPWMVAITLRQYGGEYRPHCSGFLIDRRHVLSAAHCFIENNFNVTFYQARIGRVNQTEGEMYLISRIVVPPGYQPNHIYDDIAILTLAREVSTPGYNAICLPDKEVNQMDLIGKDTSLAGWAASTQWGDISPILKQKHGIPVMDNHECSNILQNKVDFNRYFPRGMTSGIMCTEFPEGEKRSCGGDSGGPLMLRDRNRWYVIGIISFPTCGVGTEVPDGYTRISEYLKWIAENTND